MRSTTTSAGKRGRVHRKSMILRGDFDFAGFQILDRLVGAAMAKFELEGFSAEGLAQNLVPQAYPKNRDAVADQVAHGLDGVAEGRRVARSVGKKNAGRLERQRLRGGGGGRNDLHPETMLAQTAQDVVFHPEVEGDNGNVRRRQGQRVS